MATEAGRQKTKEVENTHTRDQQTKPGGFTRAIRLESNLKSRREEEFQFRLPICAFHFLSRSPSLQSLSSRLVSQPNWQNSSGLLCLFNCANRRRKRVSEKLESNSNSSLSSSGKRIGGKMVLFSSPSRDLSRDNRHRSRSQKVVTTKLVSRQLSLAVCSN